MSCFKFAVIKKNLLPWFLTGVVTLAGSPLCASTGGGMDSGGADMLDLSEGSAWFLGSAREISICLEVSSAFLEEAPEASATLRSSVESSFKRWEDYLLKRKPLSREWSPATHVRWDAACSDSTDLVFFIGIDHPKVLAAKHRYFAPASFAHRESYDLTTGWGKGFIWVALPDSLDPGKYPDLRQPKVLEAILTHEIGHALGNGHVSQTIMDRKLLNILKVVFRNGSSHTFEIDFNHELVLCDGCGKTYPGIFFASEAVFHQLTGRHSLGQIRAAVGPCSDRTCLAPYALLLTDGAGSLSCPMAFPNGGGIVTYQQDGPFRATRSDYDGQIFSTGAGVASQIDQAYVSCRGVSAGNEGSLPILIERNTATANPFAIKILGFTLGKLFDSDLNIGWY